jgi:hypothetical protein
MKAVKILFALEKYEEEKLQKGIEIISMMGVGISSVFKAESRDEITEIILSCPEINVIIVSEQLKGFFTINDFRIFQADNRIIIPVISRLKKGNSEAVGYYFNYNFYNLLFDDDNLMSEIGNIILNGRTRETAAFYAGIGQGESERENNQAGARKSIAGLYTEDIKFTVSDPGERIQPVFSSKAVLIGFCGNDFDFECTLTAISAANYIAAAGNKVALIEPDFSKGNLLDQLIPCLSENNAVSCGKVDYYSLWNLDESIKSADVVIMDFSSMNNKDSFYLCKMNKVFVCSGIILSSINRSAKHQNNSSFKYSVLYRDDLKDRAGYKEEGFDVFSVCSQELIQLVNETLSGYGIKLGDYANIGYSSTINKMNDLNRADFLDRNKNIALVERQAKDNDNDVQSDIEEQARISQPVRPIMSLTKQAQSTVNERTNVLQENILKIPEISQQQIKTMPENPQNTRPLEVNRNYKEVMTNNQDADMNYNTAKTTYKNNLKNNLPVEDEKKPMQIPGATMENGKIDGSNTVYTKANPDDYLGYNYNEENKDEYKRYEGERYEDANLVKETTMLDYIDETRNKFRKKLTANQVLCGKETIFITGLKHGCGCTHTGISFAHYIIKNFPENICICHKKGAYDLENKDITEYTKDTDYDSVFGTNRFIIYDCGILGELNADQLVELKRCNIKIMICNGDEKYLGILSNFIRQLGNTSNEWIFAFNLVTSREKEILIRRIMDGYKICFIPLHDSEIPPKKVSKMWDSVLKRNLL